MDFLKDKSLHSILLVCAALLILYYFYTSPYVLFPFLVLLIFGLISKAFRDWFHINWMRLAHFLGRINGAILLSIIYYLLLSPIALLKRLLSGKKNTDLITNRSNFVERNHIYKAEDLENPW